MISPGQRQPVKIPPDTNILVRALVQDNPEQAMAASALMVSRTVLVIAHRLSTIVEQGHNSELLARGGGGMRACGGSSPAWLRRCCRDE